MALLSRLAVVVAVAESRPSESDPRAPNNGILFTGGDTPAAHVDIVICRMDAGLNGVDRAAT